jgi:hypothetical protein
LNLSRVLTGSLRFPPIHVDNNEILFVNDLFDFLQIQAHLPEEHNLLQAEKGRIVIVARAVAADRRRFQQLDFIVIMQLPYGDTGIHSLKNMDKSLLECDNKAPKSNDQPIEQTAD